MKIKCRTRGIGLDDGLRCFVCKSDDNGAHYIENISVFVGSKEDGEKISSFFDGARLDYRPREPKWIQVKIGACKSHHAELCSLDCFIYRNSFVTETTANDCIKAVADGNGCKCYAPD